MIFEMHTHTRFGSSCSYMTPEEMVKQAVKVGLDGICITEHDIPWDQKATQRLSDKFGILVIGGMEVSTNLGEILVWGYNQSVFDLEDIEDLRGRVDKADGFMAAAHPFRGATGFIGLENGEAIELNIDDAANLEVFKWVDAMEVFNGVSPDWEVDLSCAVCDKLNLMGIGGSDAHNISAVGDCGIIFNNRIANESDFLKELKAGRFHAKHLRMNMVYPAADKQESEAL